LWVAFVLARHAAVDVTLATVMAQCEVESRVIEFLARHFGQFSTDQMTRFVEELRAAPPRVGVAQAVHTEHGGTRWIVREIQRAQLRTPGDEAQAILRARECLDVLGATAWVDETIAAAGGTAAGLLAYIGQTEPYYEMLQRIAVATPAELQIQAATIITAIEMSTNLVVQRVIPNVERVRRREMETLARLAMLESASAYQHEGQTGLQSVLDPFGKGPLVFHPTDGGFELRSSLADHGYSGSLVFLTAKDR
jgi:hypothetical protein